MNKLVLLLCLLLLLQVGVVQAQSRIKVACVGNSITEGAGLQTTYPAALQQLLGEEYEVRNYGIGGRTLLKKGDLPYWKEAKYKEVLAWNPDIVILKLGTNDAKPQNWQYEKSFVKDYKALIRSFKKLPSKPKIYVCLPIPVFEENWGINAAVVKNEVIPAIRQVARKSRVELIDLYEPMQGKAALTYDGIHPNEAGATLLATEVFKALVAEGAVSLQKE